MHNIYLSVILLTLSFTGWGLYIYIKLKFHPAFIPLYLFACFTCIVFVGGLLNIMPLMVNLIFFIGLMYFVFCIFILWKKKFSIKGLLVPSLFGFILFTVCFVLLLKGLILIHYDNFSHWGLIVKEMFRINGLPDGTTQVTFRNYPPGSAVFIYFVGKIVGYTESHALMAQALLIAANLSVLFVFCKWKRVDHLLLTGVTSIVLLVIIKNHLYNLLVDTLLGFTALSMSIIAFYYRNNWKMSLIINTPLAILLILIKDSGKFFLIINLILIVWFIYEYYFKGKHNKLVIGKIFYHVLMFLIAIPLGLNYLWIKYTQKVYPQASYSSNKFAVSISKVSSSEKSVDFKENLVPTIVKAVINFDSPFIQSILFLDGLIIIIALVIFLKKKRISKLMLKLFVFGNFVFLFYLVGIYFMYLYLMPEGEAARLAGFNRYYSTIVIYLTGLFMTFILYEFSRQITDKKKIIPILLIFAFLFIVPYHDNLAVALDRPDIQTSLRLKVKESNSKVYGSGTEITNVIYYSPKSKNDNGYLKYLLKYEQLGKTYSIVTDLSTQEDIEKLNELIHSSSHLIILDSDYNFIQYVGSLLKGKEMKNIYLIQRNKKEISLEPLDYK